MLTIFKDRAMSGLIAAVAFTVTGMWVFVIPMWLIEHLAPSQRRKRRERRGLKPQYVSPVPTPLKPGHYWAD